MHWLSLSLTKIVSEGFTTSFNFSRGSLTDGVNNFAKDCNFTKINTPPWVFFTFF